MEIQEHIAINGIVNPAKALSGQHKTLDITGLILLYDAIITKGILHVPAAEELARFAAFDSKRLEGRENNQC